MQNHGCIMFPTLKHSSQPRSQTRGRGKLRTEVVHAPPHFIGQVTVTWPHLLSEEGGDSFCFLWTQEKEKKPRDSWSSIVPLKKTVDLSGETIALVELQPLRPRMGRSFSSVSQTDEEEGSCFLLKPTVLQANALFFLFTFFLPSTACPSHESSTTFYHSLPGYESEPCNL